MKRVPLVPAPRGVLGALEVLYRDELPVISRAAALVLSLREWAEARVVAISTVQ